MNVREKNDFFPLKTIRQSNFVSKVMMIMFFDRKSVLYLHNLSPKTTVNDEYHVLI